MPDNNALKHARRVTLAAGLLIALSAYTTVGARGQAQTPQAGDASAPEVKTETPKVGESAPDFALPTLSGGDVRLSKLTRKGPVALVVLRGYPGYQCPFCTAQVAELRNKAKAFAGAKAQVLLVYPGPAENLKQRADEFVGGKAMPANFTLALDPDYTFTKAYGLRWNAPHETAYPSTFVINRKNRIVYAKTSRTHGDRAKTDEILEALAKK